MEEENKDPESAEVQTPTVGFPEIKKKKSILPLILIIVIVLAIGGFVGWLLFTSSDQKEEKVSETPTPTPFEEVTPTPEKEIDRKSVKIQVLNGTGLEKAASSLKNELEKLGYEKIEVGNATRKDYEKTVVTFSESVSGDVKDEIENELKGIYEEVDVEILDVKSFDVKIVTGFPKGHTPTPTVTMSPSKTPTPTATSSGVTNTPSPTP